jgi:uncharacterized protein YjbJ (UPF0337 family)
MGQDTKQIRDEIETTRARMSDTVEAIGYKADVPSRVRDNVNERIASVKGTIGDAVGGARDAVLGTTQSVSDSASDSLGNVQDRVSDGVASTRRAASMALENPLGLALGGLAVGLLAGLLIPITDVEREKLGPIRDDIAGRAQTAVDETLEAGKSILTDAATTAVAAAKEKGTTIAQHAVATPSDSSAEETSGSNNTEY